MEVCIGPSVCQNLHVCNQCVGLAASPGMLWYVCAGVDIQSSESMEAYKSQEVFLQIKRANIN